MFSNCLPYGRYYWTVFYSGSIYTMSSCCLLSFIVLRIDFWTRYARICSFWNPLTVSFKTSIGDFLNQTVKWFFPSNRISMTIPICCDEKRNPREIENVKDRFCLFLYWLQLNGVHNSKYRQYLLNKRQNKNWSHVEEHSKVINSRLMAMMKIDEFNRQSWDFLYSGTGST